MLWSWIRELTQILLWEKPRFKCRRAWVSVKSAEVKDRDRNEVYHRWAKHEKRQFRINWGDGASWELALVGQWEPELSGAKSLSLASMHPRYRQAVVSEWNPKGPKSGGWCLPWGSGRICWWGPRVGAAGEEMEDVLLIPTGYGLGFIVGVQGQGSESWSWGKETRVWQAGVEKICGRTRKWADLGFTLWG